MDFTDLVLFSKPCDKEGLSMPLLHRLPEGSGLGGERGPNIR